MAPDRHSMTEMHRSTNDATGANITSGYAPLANGSGGVAWGAVAASSIYFNVMDYGAVGNGTTNDQAAIQSAITAAAVAGGVVWVPGGSYKVNTVLTVPQNVSLLGAGRRASTILAGANSINVVQLTGTAMGGGTVPEVDTFQWIADLAFNANGKTGCDAIAYLGAAYFAVLRCSFTNFLVGINHYAGLQSEVHDSKFVGCATGILYTAETIGYYGGIIPPNRALVSWCSFLDNTTHAIDYSEGAQLIVENCEFDACGTVANAATSAVYYHGDPYNNETAAGLVLRGGWFEGSLGLAGIYIGTSTKAHQHSITDTFFPTNDATYAVSVDGSSGAQYLVTDRLLISTASATRGIHRTGSGAYLNLRDSTGVLAGSGGVVRQDPLLDQTNVTDLSQMLALRLPNLTTTARDAIAAPTAGMLIWNTTTSEVNRYSGAAWAAVGGGAPTGAAGGDLSGTYPNPSVVDDSHAHTGATISGVVGDQHVHVVDEQYSGDAVTTVFTLANTAAPDSVMAWVSGTRTPVTFGGTSNDQITFGSAPASAANNISVDYAAVVS